MSEKTFKNVLSNAVLSCFVVVLLCFSFFANNSLSYNNANAPISKAEDNSKVSFMFNVYWGNEYIEPILSVLKKNNITTTFFVGGTWAEKYPDILKNIASNGHEIANHGYFHIDHSKATLNRNRQEILSTHNMVKSILDIEMTLFAPPSGAYNDSTLTATTQLGYRTIMWSLDTIDWRDKDPNVVFNRIKKIKGGDLVLMHPTVGTSQSLQRMIDLAITKNLTITTVSDCINTNK